MGVTTHPLRMLTLFEIPAYESHLLCLSTEDRRRRFFSSMDDEGIRAFVDRLNLRRTWIVAHLDADLRVVGAVQVSRCGNNAVELAFSVDHGERNCGLGTDLMTRAILLARNRGASRAHVHTLAENHAMRRLAHAAGFTFEREGGECTGTVSLPPSTPLSLTREAMAEVAGLADVVGKVHGRGPLLPSPVRLLPIALAPAPG